MRNPYDVLGVSKTASEADIKKAFRRLAKRHHPDQNRDDPKAKDRFAELNAAYEILGEAAKRKAFDNGEIDAEGKPRFQGADFGFGGARPRGGQAGGSPFESYEFGYGPQGPYQRRAGGIFEGADFSDILSQAFGGGGRGPRAQPELKGEDIEVTASVTLEEIARGAKARVTLPGPRTLEVAIPDSVLDGRKMRLRGQGRPGPNGGPPGDALLTLSVARHGLYRREGRDLYLDLPLAIDEAVLGASVRVPTLTGAVEVTVPAGANDGKVLRLRGKGLNTGKTAGDLFVTLRIRLPEGDAALEAYARALRESGSYRPRGPEFG